MVGKLRNEGLMIYENRSKTGYLIELVHQAERLSLTDQQSVR